MRKVVSTGNLHANNPPISHQNGRLTKQQMSNCDLMLGSNRSAWANISAASK